MCIQIEELVLEEFFNLQIINLIPYSLNFGKSSSSLPLPSLASKYLRPLLYLPPESRQYNETEYNSETVKAKTVGNNETVKTLSKNAGSE